MKHKIFGLFTIFFFVCYANDVMTENGSDVPLAVEPSFTQEKEAKFQKQVSDKSQDFLNKLESQASEEMLTGKTRSEALRGIFLEWIKVFDQHLEDLQLNNALLAEKSAKLKGDIEALEYHMRAFQDAPNSIKNQLDNLQKDYEKAKQALEQSNADIKLNIAVIDNVRNGYREKYFSAERLELSQAGGSPIGQKKPVDELQRQEEGRSLTQEVQPSSAEALKDIGSQPVPQLEERGIFKDFGGKFKTAVSKQVQDLREGLRNVRSDLAQRFSQRRASDIPGGETPSFRIRRIIKNITPAKRQQPVERHGPMGL